MLVFNGEGPDCLRGALQVSSIPAFSCRLRNRSAVLRYTPVMAPVHLDTQGGLVVDHLTASIRERTEEGKEGARLTFVALSCPFLMSFCILLSAFSLLLYTLMASNPTFGNKCQLHKTSGS